MSERSILGRDAEGKVVDIEILGTVGPIGARAEGGLDLAEHDAHDHSGVPGVGGQAVVHAHPYAADDHTHPGGDGEHPDAAAHELLGLAADDHTHDTTHAHVEYATDDALATHASGTHGTTAHAISGVQHTGTLDHSALGSVTANQHHNQAHALGGGDHSGSLAQASVTNLTTDLAGKASTTHGHVIADTTNLQSSIDGKAASVHTHVLADGDIPAAIARDAEVTSAIATHAATPHGGESSEAFPIGAVFLSVVNTDPATLLGYGTWSQIAGGRFLVGQSADAAYDTAEETGGAATRAISAHAGAAVGSHTFTQPTATGEAAHTHTYTQTVNHVHVQTVNSATTGGLSGYTPDTSSNTPAVSGYSTQNPTGGVATGTTAGGASHTHTIAGGAVDAHSVTQPSAHTDLNVIPPYFVVYVWKRTA